MHRTNVSIEHQCESSKVGKWNITSELRLPFGMVPFVKGREDIEVLMRNQELLPEGQPIELSGFGLNTILRRSMSLGYELEQEGRDDCSYSAMIEAHPSVVSYPPDLIWLAKEDEVERLVKGIRDELPLSDFHLTTADADRVSSEIGNRLLGNGRAYSFWRRLIEKDDATNQSLSRHVMEYSISGANRARATAMGGIVPALDRKTPGSADLMHSYNVAYAAAIGERLDQGLKAPRYLYTIPVNPSVVEADSWSPVLETAIRQVRTALESAMIDGILLIVRGLKSISLSTGRVNVVSSLANKLSEIASENHLPLWWSRPGLVGLTALDTGCSFASYRLNLDIDDVYIGSGGPVPKHHQYGRILNPIMKQVWVKSQVEKAMTGINSGMPDIGHGITAPTAIDLEDPRRYRINFSKPYNISSFGYLDADWKASVVSGETEPGSQYLQSFEAPYNQWGLK